MPRVEKCITGSDPQDKRTEAELPTSRYTTDGDFYAQSRGRG